MKENEWISVEERLPGINTIVELKANTPSDHEFEYKASLSQLISIRHITHWRHITEKRHDFSKLKIGDLIFIESNKNDGMYSRIGFFCDTTNDIIVTHDGDEYEAGFNKSYVKKITRINLEEQTFEEI